MWVQNSRMEAEKEEMAEAEKEEMVETQTQRKKRMREMQRLGRE